MNKSTSRHSTAPTKSKTKSDIIEADIDVENAPVVQGSFEVTKTDADITQKRIRTSTLRPFTITNGAVRMKTKKTTIEKVKPLPKVPENLTANILKLENVTKPSHFDRTTTYRPITTTEEIPVSTITETQIRYSSTPSFTSTPKPMETTSTVAVTTTSQPIIPSSSEITSTEIIHNVSTEFMPVQDIKNPMENKTAVPDDKIPLHGFNHFTNSPLLDNQPWLPITPVDQQYNTTLKDAKKKLHNSVSPPLIRPQISSEATGFKLPPRNKVRIPIDTNLKTKLPVHYHSYTNPAFMYGLQEVERLGNGYVQPYPIPVDKINEPLIPRDPNEELVLNKGEMLTTNKQQTKIETITTIKPPEVVSVTSSKIETDNISLASNNTTSPTSNGYGSTENNVGNILYELLNAESLSESNSSFSMSSTEDSALSRMDEIDLPDDHTETLEALATAISSMETLSFKNIKDYIMATTKSFIKETVTQSTTPNFEYSKSNNTTFRSHATTVTIEPPSTKPMTMPVESQEKHETSDTKEIDYTLSEHDVPTPSYVEVETVQYTPSGVSWDAPALFPVQSKWEYVNGSAVYPDKLPMRKVFNETLQAWIIENPKESYGNKINPEILVRNHTEPIKNISAIFDTLASKLGIAPNVSTKLPPFMSHFTNNKHKTNSPPRDSSILSTTNRPSSASTNSISTSRAITTTTEHILPSSRMPTSLIPTDDGIPVLLHPISTESAESFVGQAEVEEVDPTQYEQMLLIDKVSSALRPTSTAPSLVTLLPVKSNSGIRFRSSTVDRLANSGRGFIPPKTKPNRKQFEDTAFVVRTNINVSS